MTAMPVARYKDLCIDAVDAERMGRFWAAALELQLEPLDDGDARLTGAAPEEAVWVNRVPEALTVKQRVHLDVRAASVADIEKLGATVVDGTSFPWTVMRDPEGGELCVFPSGADGRAGLMDVVVDAKDVEGARAIARWWAEVLGGRSGDDAEHQFSYVEDVPAAPFESLVFVPVPEPKTVKNRIHLDVTTEDVEELVAAGAALLRPQDDEIEWSVMADPDGNEFCAFVR